MSTNLFYPLCGITKAEADAVRADVQGAYNDANTVEDLMKMVDDMRPVWKTGESVYAGYLIGRLLQREAVAQEEEARRLLQAVFSEGCGFVVFTGESLRHSDQKPDDGYKPGSSIRKPAEKPSVNPHKLSDIINGS